MLTALAILALLVVPRETVARDQCQRIERSNFYDTEGKLVFCQVVAWEQTGRVFFWRLDKGAMHIAKDHATGNWRLTFDDGGLVREVWAKSFDTSFEQRDVEVEDREILPVTERRRLRGAK